MIKSKITIKPYHKQNVNFLITDISQLRIY